MYLEVLQPIVDLLLDEFDVREEEEDEIKGDDGN